MSGTASQDAGHPAPLQRASGLSRKTMKKAFKAIMKSYKFKQLPAAYDLPLRLRPWFLVFTAIVMLSLAFLGFTNFSRALPLNDKILHLVCLCLATTVFYFIFDVEEDARRIWVWRHSALILTGIFCFLFGGIVSEIVQSLLPYKEFQMGDVAANLIGSAIGLWTAYYLERYYRRRREISRLYRPISLDPDEAAESDSDDDASGTMLLPMHHGDRTVLSAMATKPKTKEGRSRLGNVWDEREELFGIGDSDDDEDEQQESPPSRPTQMGPKIIVTPSS